MTILNLGDLVEAREGLFKTFSMEAALAGARAAVTGWMEWRTQEERRVPALVVSASHNGLNAVSGTHDGHVTLMELATPQFRTCTVNPTQARVRLLNAFATCLDVSGSL